MIRMTGSRQEILQGLRETFDKNFPQEDVDDTFFETLFDTMYKCSSGFSEDEAFILLNESFSEGDKLLTPNKEYFIGVCSSTFFAVTVATGLYVDKGLSVTLAIAQKLLFSIAPESGTIVNAPLIKKMEKALGESCIMLEAFEKRPDGIDKNVLSGNRHECVHVNLECNFMDKHTGMCNCIPEDIDEILKKLENDKLLYRKRRKYYYNDIL